MLALTFAYPVASKSSGCITRKRSATWCERFIANRQRIAALYDERFRRMWEFYLVLCKIGFRFRFRSMVVLQMQLAKRSDAVPLTRDCMVSSERANAPTAHRLIRVANEATPGVLAPRNRYQRRVAGSACPQRHRQG